MEKEIKIEEAFEVLEVEAELACSGDSLEWGAVIGAAVDLFTK